MPHPYLYRVEALPWNAKPQLGVSQRSLADLGLGAPGRSLVEKFECHGREQDCQIRSALASAGWRSQNAGSIE